jgi:protein SCO1/2
MVVALAAFGSPVEGGRGPAAPTGAGFRLPAWPLRAASPGFDLVGSLGRPKTLADYRGGVTVVLFGYAQCPDVCPAELFTLSLVMKHLRPLDQRVQVLFVTLDPERDTAQVLDAYVRGFDPRFRALTGSTAQVDRAAARFFVEYARVPNARGYSIDHSAGMFLIDKQGRLRVVAGAGAAVEDLVHDLRLLLRD